MVFVASGEIEALEDVGYELRGLQIRGHLLRVNEGSRRHVKAERG